MRAVFLLILVSGAALAGCVDEPAADEFLLVDIQDAQALIQSTGKQLAAHPAYGYPTLLDYSGFDGAHVPEAWMPPAPITIPETISSIDLLAEKPEGVGTGSGIAVFGHYVLVSGTGAIIDIADPSTPVMVSQFDFSSRDADIVAYPDGRLVAVMASSGPIHLADITDPHNPVQLPDLDVRSHNAVVVPGTPIVYNANSRGGNDNGLVGTQSYAGGVGKTEIFDLSDPTDPKRLPDFDNGYGCHDITTYIDVERDLYRAYCAGIEVTQIWDIADPTAPRVVSEIPVHHGVAGAPHGSVPVVLFSHLAMVNHDASVLIVGDESGGGIANACDVYSNEVPGSASGPTGNLWFYDVSEEANPVLKGWINPNNPATDDNYQQAWLSKVEAATDYQVGDSPAGVAVRSLPSGCTAHFGRLLPDREQLAIAFYGAGVLIVDFEDPSDPKVLAQYTAPGVDSWDVWEYQGYLFTGDIGRGLDVLILR